MAAEGSTETARGKVQRTEPTKPQRAAARRVAESKATIPHFYLEADAALPRPLSGDERTAAIVKSAAVALREHPRLNGAYRDGGFEAYSRINVGVAIGAGQDAACPTIFDAADKPDDAIAAELANLRERIESRAITSPELAGGTFTVSAIAAPDVRAYAPIINSGQAAALAVGSVGERAIVRDSEVTVASVMTLTLACDARIVGSEEGAAFLASVRELLEEPDRLA